MYRNKARAAHKLQQQYPPLNQQQQQQLPPLNNHQQQVPPVQTQQLPPAGDQQQQPPGGWNGQQQQQPGGGGVLMFNPSQYQNGVVETPPVVPNQQPVQQQQVDHNQQQQVDHQQQQQVDHQQQQQVDHQQQQQQVDHHQQQQWNGDAQYGGSGGGWNQNLPNNQDQDVNHNHNVAEEQWQGYHQRQDRAGPVLSEAGSSVSQQQQYGGYQQQQQEYQQQQLNADQYQAVHQNQQSSVDNQPQQQNSDHYQQTADPQNQQQTVDSSSTEEPAPALQLILDDSGQWYWNYHLQQWQPYYGGDGTYPPPEQQQQNAGSQVVAEAVAQDVDQGGEEGGGVSMFYNNDVVEDIGQITNQISQLTVAAQGVEPEKEKGSRRNSQMSADSHGQMRTRQDSQMSADSHGQMRTRQDSQMSSDSYSQGHQMPAIVQYTDHKHVTNQFGEIIQSNGPGNFGERKSSVSLEDSQLESTVASEQLGNEYHNGLMSESGVSGPTRDSLQQQYDPLIQFSPNPRQDNSPSQGQVQPLGDPIQDQPNIPPTSNHDILASPPLQFCVGVQPEASAAEAYLAPLPMFQTPPISQEQPQHQEQPPLQYQPPPQQQAHSLQHHHQAPPLHQPHPAPQQEPSSHPPPQHSGPPDVVDHRPDVVDRHTSQPEIVSDLEWSVTSSSQGSPAHQPHPDLHPQPLQPTQWRHGPPDITSVPSVIAGHPAPPPSQLQPPVSHDQHYDYYKMPDVTAGRATPPQPLPPPPKAPDILRTAEPVMPSSDRNLFMETGELTEEDAVRVHPPPPMSLPAQLPPMVGAPPPPSAAILHPPANLPPMVGGNEPPSVSRMVLGEMLQPEFPPNDSQLRLVEGESVPTLPPMTQPSFDRSVEGESGITPIPITSLPNRQVEGGSITSSPTIPPNSRRVEGESIAPPPSMGPPPLRRVEGEAGPSLPHPTLPQGGREVEVEGESGPPTGPPINPPPLMDQRIVTGLENQSLTAPPPVVKLEVNSPSAFHPPPTSAFYPPPPSQYYPPPPTSETRCETVGSDRRDETVMGGPIGAKATPLPTPGRDVAGSEGGLQEKPNENGKEKVDFKQRDRKHDLNGVDKLEERGHESGREKAVNKTRDRNYESDDDMSFRDRDSGGDSDRDRRHQSSRPRRSNFPESSRHERRWDERHNRSSTERDEESDRRHKLENDRREYRKKHEHERSMRSDHDRSYYNDRDRKGNRYDQERYRHRDYDEHHRHRRDDDERSYRGGASVKDEPLDRSYNNRSGYKRESEFDRSSFYDEDYRKPSRPSSRSGSVAHYDRDPMELIYTMQQQQAAMYQQQMQQQMMMQNPQYQQQLLIQEAVQKMEKAVADPANAKIYKQHWDHYQMQPQAFEKMKLDNPIQHHVLTQFAEKYLHVEEENKDQNDNNKDQRKFSEEFHQLSPGHRAESWQGQEESTIYNENTMGNFVDSVVGVVGDDNQLPDRLTPVMFSRPHVCARIAPSGLLVKVDSASPLDGQSATIELHHMSQLLGHLPESSELTSFPGPLVPGETHKNDVIKFCERKIHSARDRRSMADRDSYILLWEMLILLLRQNGQVEGSDIADLLLKDYIDPSSTSYTNGQRAESHAGSLKDGSIRHDGSHAGSVKDGSLRYDGAKDDTTSSASSVHNEESNDQVVAYSKKVINPPPTEDVTCRFRDYLLHGNKHEGLEYAMREGLWGHALFLASKMDQRTYAGVMTRFANGLALNDPLQTLYQLMSSRQPTAMKQCADQRWGDWRPHLAMILSNQVAGNLNRQSMVTLGDTLGSKGQLHAAQFCYIVSGCEFGTFTKRTCKLVLLCSTMSDSTLEEFATNEAIQCTEIYEFVQKLGNRELEMATLQVYKFLYAIRLLDNGLPGLAQHYCKIIADFVVRNPTRVETDFLPDFIFQLESLAERLKYQDPVYTTSVGEINEIPDPEWLVKFHETVETYFRGGNPVNTDQSSSYDQDYNSLQYQQEENNSLQYQQDYSSLQYQQQQDDAQQTYGGEQNDTTNHQPPEMYDANQQETANQAYDPGYQAYDGNQAYDGTHQMYDPSAYNQQDPSHHAQEPHVSETVEAVDDATEASEQQQPASQPVMFNPNLYNQNQNTFFNPDNFNNPPIPEEPQGNETSVRRPSLAEMSRRRSRSTTSQADSGTPTTPTASSQPPPPNFSLYEGIRTKSPPSSQPQPPPPAAAAPAKVEKEKKKVPQKPTQKSSWMGGLFGKLFKGGNQVHLPDDTDKTIVFDEKLGRWVNTDGDEDDLAPAAPPPMDSAFAGGKSRPGPTAGPGGYSMSGAPGKRKGRGYVDVFAKAGATTPAAAPPTMLLPPTAGAPPGLAPTPAILNPGVGMPLDPANMPTSFPTAEGSSSPGAAAAPETNANGPTMTFFNPSSMAGVTGPPAF